MKRIFSFMLAILIIISVIPMHSVYAYTPEDYLQGLTWDEMTDSSKWAFIFNWTVAEVKAVIDGDASNYIMGMTSMKDFITSHDPDDYVQEDNKTVIIPKEFVELVKQCIDDYAKQNEPYYLVNTLTLSDCAGNDYNGSKIAYDTVKNLLDDSPSGVVAWGCRYSKPTNMWFVDIGNDFKNVSPVKYQNNNLFVSFYDNETWGLKSYTSYNVDVGVDGEAISTADEFKEKAQHTYNNQYMNTAFRVYPSGNTPAIYPYDVSNANSWVSLITKERRRIRVFNTYGDFQNYTLGKRSVYYTKEYYSYVPENLTTSIDDLQDSVDDLQKVIDDLLSQITKDTDESEIEDLLRQILDELKNQQGTGGGGGSGGGDVTVNVDMTQTNSWLAQIHAKVSQIYDKMNSTVEAAEDAALARIQESLDEIIEQLKKIKRWTAVDTVIDGVDAVADWLDLIRDVLEDGAGSAVAALSSALSDSTDLMKQKFPFSIPWDILFFVTVLSAEPETPQFSIPFNFEFSALDLAVDYEMELDFTPLQWLSDLSRLLLSLTYAAGLMKKTVDIVSANKEG